MRQIILALFIALVVKDAVTQEFIVGSPAQLWGRRSTLEKSNFLEGMCAGFQTSDQYKLGELFCDTTQSAGRYRFCFSVNVNGGRDAIAYLDLFYQNKNQTEIFYWAAIAAYNDKACKENLVTSNLPQMQRRNECLRQSFNMVTNKGVGPEAKKAQDAYCKTL
jgi:hypothetical protein